jgi:hypothetical protein
VGKTEEGCGWKKGKGLRVGKGDVTEGKRRKGLRRGESDKGG